MGCSPSAESSNNRKYDVAPANNNNNNNKATRKAPTEKIQPDDNTTTSLEECGEMVSFVFEMQSLVGLEYFQEEYIAGYSGDDYKPRLCHIKEGSTMEVVAEEGTGHTSPITGIACLASNTAIVTCSHDGLCCIWTERKSTSCLSVYKELSCDVNPAFNHVCGSKDGSYVVASAGESLQAASIDDEELESPAEMSYHVYIWLVTSITEKKPKIFGRHKQEVVSMSFCDCSTRVATGSRDGVVMIWYPTTCMTQHVLSAHTSPLTSLTFSEPARSYFVSSDAHKICIWDMNAGMLLFTTTAANLEIPTVRCVRFVTPSHVLVTGNSSSIVYAINVLTGEAVAQVKVPDSVLCLSGSQRLSVLVGCKDGGISKLNFSNLCSF